MSKQSQILPNGAPRGLHLI